MSLEEIRQEAEVFLEELVEEEYKNRAGFLLSMRNTLALHPSPFSSN